MAPCMSEVAGPAIIAAAVWEMRNTHFHGSHNLAGSWQMSTCTHIVCGLHCLRHFKYKLRFLAFLGRLKAVAILGPYSCSEDLEPSMSGRAVLSSSHKFPAGVCQPPLSPLTRGTSVGTEPCDPWVCQGRIRLRGMKYKFAWGQLKMQRCMVESIWNREPGARWWCPQFYI